MTIKPLKSKMNREAALGRKNKTPPTRHYFNRIWVIPWASWQTSKHKYILRLVQKPVFSDMGHQEQLLQSMKKNCPDLLPCFISEEEFSLFWSGNKVMLVLDFQAQDQQWKDGKKFVSLQILSQY